MVAAKCKDAEAAQQIEITIAVAVEQISASPASKADVIADGFENPDELLIEISPFSGMFLLAAAGAASAADPLGEWRDEDGKATIRIVDCNSRSWGVVASESIPGGSDKNNPDKAKRTRPMSGMPILS
ncbi:hypothetical protein OY671_009616, partial [Metschnikowia pulcherrima]